MAAKVEIEQPELPNTTILKRIAYDNLIVQLESMHGAKDLVIDEELMKPLDRIAGVSVLKRHGVEKIFKLDKQNIETGCHRRIYITRPYISRMKMIVEHVRNDQLKSIHGEYKILLTPKRQLAVCELVLEREGIYGDVSIDEFPLDFISLDEDVLSMEMPLCFKDIYLNGDHTWTPIVARIINTIQSTYGSIRNYTCIGNSSKAIYDLLQVFTEDEKEFVPEGGPEIASAIIIDRDVDYVTPLLSQLSYEGLLADVFGISRFISFGRDVTGDEKTTRLVLDSNDKVFQEIRGLHFTSVFPLLSSKAKELQFGYDKRKDMTSVNELKNFVSQDLKLLKQQHKSLTIHIGACESVLKKKTEEEFERFLQTEQNLLDDTCTRETADFVEECINKQHSSLDSLRLLCLMSLTRASLDINRLKSLKLQYVQSFGYDRLITLNNLKKSGLLAEKPERKGLFQKARKKLNLVPRDSSHINLRKPNDMAYIFGGAYSPLSVKLVEQVLLKGAQSIDDVTKALSAPLFCIRKPSSARATGSHTQSTYSALRTVLVVFVGGCSHSEITALRFLGIKHGYRFLILTTAIVTGVSFISTLLPASLATNE
eukprot:gene9524-10510_t